MLISCQFEVFDRDEPVYYEEFEGPAEMGRQSDEDEVTYSQQFVGDCLRIVIAGLNESRTVSRRHIRLEPLADERLRITNVSRKIPVLVERGSELKPGSSLELALPVTLILGSKRVEIQPADPEEEVPLEKLAEATLVPGINAPSSSAVYSSLHALPLSSGVDAESLVGWMRAAMEVLQTATGAQDFFARAARAVVDLVGLDAGRVLLLENETWKQKVIQTNGTGDARLHRPPSRRVLRKVWHEKRTFWRVQPAVSSGSLAGVDAVVAAPILNGRGDVIGALYGDRSQHGGGFALPISKPEAMLVELLAGGIAAGLARVEQEQMAVRAQVQFEQFFTPELARELAARPELLTGKDLEVTVLFCDIRGFSRITERLGADRTVEWLNDVLGALSKCVLDQGGVLSDYVGDEIMAMFGAPVAHKDHAIRACRSALAMLELLPKLQERWLPVVQERMGLGIGINTGIARVGNIGSKYKFKYGALGNTVNLASRVQGATKYLKAPVLITEATCDRLNDEFATRRLGPVRVVNIEQSVVLHELAALQRPGWSELKRGYEKALAHFERQEFVQVVEALGQLLPTHPEDGPSLVLMFLAVNYLREAPAHFDPVWELPGK